MSGEQQAEQAVEEPEENVINACPVRHLRARWVFPVASPPIPDGTVTIEADRIAAVGSRSGGGAEDLGNVAILPGLVNVHTHLDLSDLPAPLGPPGVGFPDWIRRVVDYRRRVAGEDRRPVESGLAESARLGTTALGDIMITPLAPSGSGSPNKTPLSPSGRGAAGEGAASLSGTIFLELIAPTAARIAPALELARKWIQQDLAFPLGEDGGQGIRQRSSPEPYGPGSPPSAFRPPPSAFRLGLSPHAPYSVHWELLSRIVALSAAEHVPLAMHLAESGEELQLLRSRGGPLRELLEELGGWDPSAREAARRPLDYLRALASAHRALVVHGNYLDDEEIAFLAAQQERLAVAYCPRTHVFFGHAPYPLEKMLAAGVRVALGTDSRASSPDLSVLAEMRCVAQRHPAVARDVVLRMGTIHGASALEREREIGSLEPGKYADLAVVALPDHDAADPHDLLLEADLPVVATWQRGRAMYSSRSA